MMDSARIKKLLANRHPMGNGEWVTMFELRNGTGFTQVQTRYMDCFAIHTYPSKGHIRHGYEIKVSRADWLAELAQPEKRRWAMEISNQFWFVAPTGIIKKDEVPEGCGLLLVTETGMLVRDVVAKHHAAREFRMDEIASMLRSVLNLKTDKLWKYQGVDLSHEGMMDVLTANQGRIIHTEVEKIVARKVKHVEEILRAYAAELRNAGCTPPHWMENGYIYGARAWDAAKWVSENVAPGMVASEIKKLSRL